MDSVCDSRQDSPGSVPKRAGFLLVALPESLLQGTSIDLQSPLTLLLSKIESNKANVTKTNNVLHEIIPAQEQDKAFLHPDSSEYQRDDFEEDVRLSSEELRLVNIEIDFTVGEVVQDQAEAMSTIRYSLVAALFNQNSPVPKTPGHLSSHSHSQGVKIAHSTSSKKKLGD